MLLSTEAIILKSISYGDSSIISTILTKDFGKVSIIAKGIKKNKSTNRVLLEPINIVNINYYFKKNRRTQILKNIDLSVNLSKIRKNLDDLNIALILVDTINNTLQEYEDNNLIFRLCKSTLTMINAKKTKRELLLSFFLLHLYIQLGYMPNFERCNNCQIEVTSINLNLVKEDLLCKKCNSGTAITINNKQLLGLKRISETHIKDIRKLDINKEDNNIINKFLYKYGSVFLNGFKNIKSFNREQYG